MCRLMFIENKISRTNINKWFIDDLTFNSSTTTKKNRTCDMSSHKNTLNFIYMNSPFKLLIKFHTINNIRINRKNFHSSFLYTYDKANNNNNVEKKYNKNYCYSHSHSSFCVLYMRRKNQLRIGFVWTRYFIIKLRVKHFGY